MQQLSLNELQTVNGGGLLDILNGNNSTTGTNGSMGLDNLLGGVIRIWTDDANGMGTQLHVALDLGRLFNGLNNMNGSSL